MTPTVWAILAALACVGTSIGIARFVAASKTPTARTHVVTACEFNGHGLRYRVGDTQWFCATCGDPISAESVHDQIKAAAGSPRAPSLGGSMLAGVGQRSARLEN